MNEDFYCLAKDIFYLFLGDPLEDPPSGGHLEGRAMQGFRPRAAMRSRTASPPMADRALTIPIAGVEAKVKVEVEVEVKVEIEIEVYPVE